MERGSCGTCSEGKPRISAGGRQKSLVQERSTTDYVVFSSEGGNPAGAEDKCWGKVRSKMGRKEGQRGHCHPAAEGKRGGAGGARRASGALSAAPGSPSAGVTPPPPREIAAGPGATTYYLILTTYHSLLTTYYLPLTTHYLLLTTYHSHLTTYHLPLATCHLPLTTYYLLLTTGIGLSDMQVWLSEMQRDCSRCNFSHLGPPPLHVGPPHFTGSAVLLIIPRHSTRERDFRPECKDAPRESAISGQNARTLHARARFSARMRGRYTQEHDPVRRATCFTGRDTILLFFKLNRARDFETKCPDAPRENAIFRENARTLHARVQF